MRLFGSNPKHSKSPSTLSSTTQPLSLSEDVLLESKLSHTYHRDPSSHLSAEENTLTALSSSGSINVNKNEERIQRLLGKNQNECTSKERRLIRRYKIRSINVEVTNLRSDHMKVVDIFSDINNKINKQEDSILFHESDTQDVEQLKTLDKGHNKPKEQTLIKGNRKDFMGDVLMQEDYLKTEDSNLKNNPDNIIFDKKFVEDNMNKKIDKQISDKINKNPNLQPNTCIENSVRNTQGHTSVTKLKFNKMKKKKNVSHLPLLEQKRRLEQRKLQLLAKEKREYKTAEHSHPLNSERRRANRRKPSLKQKIIHKLSCKKKYSKELKMYRKVNIS